MTSNQINYWRNVETERANKAEEAERRRHNEVSESVEKGTLNVREREAAVSELRAELERQGLEIKDKEAFYNLIELYSKYGGSLAAMPPEFQEQLSKALGVDYNIWKQSPESWEDGVLFGLDEFFRRLSQLGGLRGIASFF